MARNVLFLIFCDLIVVKTGKVIEILVILANVIQAEVEILPLTVASHRRLVSARIGASFPGALIGSAGFFFLLLCPSGLNPDLVKYV